MGKGCLSIRMQATECYLSCAHEDKCLSSFVVFLQLGFAYVYNLYSHTCKHRSVQTLQPRVPHLY